MNNNSSLNYHCFSCGKQIQINTNNSPIRKYQYPICNQTTDTIYLEKHILCIPCHLIFQDIRIFVSKYKLQWFNKQFKLQKIIDPTFIKMSHIQTTLSFIKQNRKSQISQISQKNQQNKLNNDQKYLIGTQGIKTNINYNTDIYSSIINDNIEQNHLHNVFWLPKTVQYLIYLTSVQRIKSQQRKQRVKKIIQLLSYSYFIDQSDLKYLAILIQNLLCFMDEQQLLKIMDPLLKSFIKNNISLNFFILEDKFDDLVLQRSFEGRIHKNKIIDYKPDSILENIFAILILSDFFKDAKLKKHIDELKKICFIQQQEISKSSIVGKNTKQKVYENYLKKNIPQNLAKLTKLSSSNWQQIIQIKKQKNYLNLIIKIIKRQQEQNNTISKQLQIKNKKQKDEYVNKIIKLNNKIYDLEQELKNSKQIIINLTNQNIYKQKQINILLQNNQLSTNNLTQNSIQSSNQKPKSNKKNKDNDDQCKSNPELNSKQKKQNFMLKDKHQKQNNFNQFEQKTQNYQTSRTQMNQAQLQTQGTTNKKHKSEIQNTHLQQSSNINNLQQNNLDYMKSILTITDLVSFNQKINKKSSSFPLAELPNSFKELSQLIIVEINQLQKKVSSLVNQNKKLKDQSSRVLSILKRKQEQWLPLFHEKDQIISLYQKALICLQNGMILADQPLCTRIKLILSKITKIQFLRMENQQDQISMRDSILQVDDSFGQNTSRQSQSSPNKQEKGKQIQKIKQIKQKQKNSASKNKSQAANNQKTVKKKTKKQKQKQSQCQIF